MSLLIGPARDGQLVVIFAMRKGERGEVGRVLKVRGCRWGGGKGGRAVLTAVV